MQTKLKKQGEKVGNAIGFILLVCVVALIVAITIKVISWMF